MKNLSAMHRLRLRHPHLLPQDCGRCPVELWLPLLRDLADSQWLFPPHVPVHSAVVEKMMLNVCYCNSDKFVIDDKVLLRIRRLKQARMSRLDSMKQKQWAKQKRRIGVVMEISKTLPLLYSALTLLNPSVLHRS